MPRKQRSPDDVHDIWNVEVGKPYRGQVVEKIEMETTDLPNGKVKVRRLIYLDNEIILIEDTWHEYGEVYADGVLLPYDQINFPSMDPADFAAPLKSKEDDDEKKKKRELLRQKARDMLKNKGNSDPPVKKPRDETLKLKVKTPDGRILPVVMKPDDTVDDLKEKIEDDHNIPVEEQNLSLKGTPLTQPNATMDDIGAKSGDTIDMAPKTMDIIVRTPEGKELSITVTPTDSVRELKEKIEDDHSIPVEDQNLSFKGTPINDPSSTLEDHGIEDGDILDLEPNNTTITVHVNTPEGKKLSVHVWPTDTVDDLKATIEHDHSIPVEDQNLSFNGTPLSDPDSTMEENGIEHDDIVDMEPNDTTITVRIRTPKGKKLSVTVLPTDTLQNLKETIENDHDIPVGDQNLSFKGTPLDDPSSTMEDNGIEDNDVVDLLADDMTINVRTPEGKTFSIPVKPENTVRDVKKVVESMHGIPAKDQILKYEGEPLEDPGETMKDLGISDGDTLDLDPARKKPPKAKENNGGSKPKAKKKIRVLNPDSAWVYPTKASAPKEGEIENLQGIWSTPPEKGGTDPVEVNIHPKDKEPKSDGKSDIHGAYGYINGAKPDANGVVDPANVVFYPPGQKDYDPDFDHRGWWSAPESSSKTTVSWKFVGDDCYNVRKHTVNVMGHEMTFVKEWIDP